MNSGASMVGERQEQGERPVRRLWWRQTAGKSQEHRASVNGMGKADTRALETDLGGGGAQEEGGFKDGDLKPQ